MDIVEQIRNDGIAKGLCNPWQAKLSKPLSIEALVRLYVRGVDFCISKDYPTLDFLRGNLKGKCEQYGVFIDDVIQSKKNIPDVVLNGDCMALLEYSDYSVSRVYIRHNSKVAINVSDHALLTIDAFDNSNLVVATAGNAAQVNVNLYGNAQVESIGDGIKIKYKNRNTY